jgi:hypothetical protein
MLTECSGHPPVITPQFDTFDLALAAFLRCLQYPLVDVRRENQSRSFTSPNL